MILKQYGVIFEKYKKYLNNTKDEIIKYLEKVKAIVKSGNYTVANGGKDKKNIEFVNKYNLNVKKIRKMLLEISELDFCYSIDDYNNINERLYVFAKQYELDFWGEYKKVLVYIKLAMKENDYLVVISFHEPKKKIKQLFI